MSEAENLPALVRPAGNADAAALALCGQATFLETFAGVLDGGDIVTHCSRQHHPDVYLSLLAQRRTRVWLAETQTGGAPVGYAVLGESSLLVADASPADLELKRIYLLGRFQGRGVGRALMATALGAAEEMGAARVLLGVYSRNARAITFYQRAGFHPVGERRFLVGARHYDDVILGRTL